jgi:hypothetical protein
VRHAAPPPPPAPLQRRPPPPAPLVFLLRIPLFFLLSRPPCLCTKPAPPAMHTAVCTMWTLRPDASRARGERLTLGCPTLSAPDSHTETHRKHTFLVLHAPTPTPSPCDRGNTATAGAGRGGGHRHDTVGIRTGGTHAAAASEAAAAQQSTPRHMAPEPASHSLTRLYFFFSLPFPDHTASRGSTPS